MKTAISLPDEIFDEAERLAHALDVSRSELYRRAIVEYVARHASDRITQTLDRLSSELDMRSDPFVSRAAKRAFDRTEW